MMRVLKKSFLLIAFSAFLLLNASKHSQIYGRTTEVTAELQNSGIVRVSVRTLLDDLRDNIVLADQRYRNQTIELIGSRRDLRSGINPYTRREEYYIILADREWGTRQIKAFFPSGNANQLARISWRQDVVVRGRFIRSADGSVILLTNSYVVVFGETEDERHARYREQRRIENERRDAERTEQQRIQAERRAQQQREQEEQQAREREAREAAAEESRRLAEEHRRLAEEQAEERRRIEEEQRRLAEEERIRQQEEIARWHRELASRESVVINGVRWATRNVGAPGTFVANPEDAGIRYSWYAPRRRSWVVTNSNGRASANPCPRGWRVPTEEELRLLINAGSVWVTINGVNGRFFGTEPNWIFLPVLRGSMQGDYWSRTQVGSSNSQFATYLDFDIRQARTHRADSRQGFAVRCVAN